MDVEEFRTKPPWEDYEETLLRKGFTPCFDPEQAPLPVTCCRCGTTSVYVVLADATTTIGFLVCAPCGTWIGRAIADQTTGAQP